ncbi:hypothetical protein BDY19DRAFT_947965 [Irpex rosettiformis]|uniref:Uncharacterized protein n=1 Tax=Irpex rosettiformis TaxID=378272 RepID=A0ACB8U2A9_9APHY|nr:hypothetical protein BDY19DRAFT_947965 [Irpex rosettiformis]
MEPETQQQYTILRIKRKRNEEPLDALVVEGGARRKKTKGPMNVFQFAETVEPTTWHDERQKQDLQTRISNLARRETISKRGMQFKPSAPGDASKSAENAAPPTPERKAPRKLPQIDDPSRKYTIVPSESVQSPVKTVSRMRPTEPPKVHSYKDLQKASFTMYEAIPSSKSVANMAGPPDDPEIAKFLPMLNDYLRLSGEGSSLSTSSSENAVPNDDDDYVWDVFYSRPATFREFYSSYSNVGTVTGLPDDDDQGSESDSEFDDELDEDSNAEDWYKNDYPDEESPSNGEEDASGNEGSDVFHEDSDYEELIHERPT